MAKAFTNINQSRGLSEIIPPESADMCYYYKDDKPQLTPYSEHNNRYYIPCWSLDALLNYLREIDFFPEIDADECSVTMNINYYNEEEARLLAPIHNIKVKAESFIDACYEMIIKLHEQKLNDNGQRETNDRGNLPNHAYQAASATTVLRLRPV